MIALKNEGILDLFYVQVEKTDNLIFIRSEQILSKCLIKHLDKKRILISEFLVENDYN